MAPEGLVLTDAQGVAVETAKADQAAPGECVREGLGSGGAQATFSGGTRKGVGRFEPQTVIETSSTVGVAKLDNRKPPITAAELLNDPVRPFFEPQESPVSRMLTDRGPEYGGAPARQE